MNNKKLILFLLLTITLLGFFLRFYEFGEIPAGLYDDEAGQGYSAYSILKTGKDEFGKDFPIIFRSFTDFKTPVSVYLVAASIQLFDVTKFAVRFPALFFSMLTFPLIYFLITKITKEYKFSLALLVTFLLAISPWHILFSRTNYEVNVALLLYLLGIYLFYQGLRRPILLIFSVIVFALSLPAYHSERIITPITVLVLFIKYREQLLQKNYIKYLIISLVIGIVITLPTLFIMTTPGFLSRASTLSIFSAPNERIWGYNLNYEGPFESIVNNKQFIIGRQFTSLYFSYLSSRYMFSLGDSGQRSSFPDLPTFYIWQLPFYLIGIFVLLKAKNLGEIKFLTILMLLIAPIPAAVTSDPYNTNRSIPLLIPQLIIISLGILKSFSWIPHKFRLIATGTLVTVISYSLIVLWSSVIILNEYYRPEQWNYGWEEVVSTLESLDKNVPVVVDIGGGENYIQLAFFLKYDPVAYQQDNYEVPLNEYYTNMTKNRVRKMGRYTVKPLNWEEDFTKEQYLVAGPLFISDPEIKNHNLILIKDIKYLDGSVAFRIVKVNKNKN